jgi:type IV secretion system protein VirD4
VSKLGRLVWPAPIGPHPPRSGLLVLAAVVFGLAVVGMALVPGRPRRSRPLRRTPPPGRNRARWATRRDLRSLSVPAAGAGRLVIGRSGRTLVATEARHSLLVVGPTQSGKTTGLAIPAILEWEGPVLATSVKDDLASATLAWRATQGRTWVFDPTAASGLGPAASWTPLAEAATWTGAQRMASWLVDAAPARGGLSDGAFWYAAAAKLLAPLLLAAHRSGGTMADVVRWTNLDDCEEAGRVLGASGEEGAGVALAACAARDDRIRSSVTTTLETVLTPFEDPVVAAATATAEIHPHRLLEGPHTLYLCGPSHEQARVQGLFAALVSAVVATAVEQANQSGAPLDPPLLLVLDEAANIAPLRDLDTLASTGAGLGIQLLTVCQDLAQLAHRYGPERSRTIANNHRGKLMLSGVSDLTTLDLISGLAGEAAIREETESRDLRDGRRTRTSSTAFRRLVAADELRRISPGDGVLVYGHLPPARVRLRPWYQDRALRARAHQRRTSP